MAEKKIECRCVCPIGPWLAERQELLAKIEELRKDAAEVDHAIENAETRICNMEAERVETDELYHLALAAGEKAALPGYWVKLDKLAKEITETRLAARGKEKPLQTLQQRYEDLQKAITAATERVRGVLEVLPELRINLDTNSIARKLSRIHAALTCSECLRGEATNE